MQSSPKLWLLVVGVLVRAAGTDGTLVAYWNVPLETCSRQGVAFNLGQFDIVHNAGNVFEGDRVNILYQPGRFPHYSSTGVPVNGGIPQRGNLSLHLATFRQQIQLLPSNYTGLLVLDFELYLPSFTVSLPSLYRNQSVEWVRQQHPNWTRAAILQEAQRTFNASAKLYFEALLQEAAKHHPGALVGYYHYPYCEDYEPPFLHCAPQLQELNDELRPWLLDSSHALYPSVYLQQRYSASRQWRIVNAKLTETQRIRKKNVPVLPYLRYRYGGSNELVGRSALLRLLWLIRTRGSQGLVVWGSLANLASRKSCLQFKAYLYSTLGPALKCFHKMTGEDVQEIQSRFSAISDNWLSMEGKDNKYYHYLAGRRTHTEETFVNFFDYNQHVHPMNYPENFEYEDNALSALNPQNYGIVSTAFHGGQVHDFVTRGRENKKLNSAKVSPYPDSAELLVLSTLIQNYCALY